MRAVDIIAKKRDRQALTTEEIEFFIQGLTRDEVPDYQVAAWAMAVLLNGMDPRETADLTMAMVRSGQTLNLDAVAPIVVDKHSTGGVGDKTTLAVVPMVAAAGLPVAKMSGRGLGFSGGTLDKLESIPGYDVSLDIDRFLDVVRRAGVVVAGQTADLAPADGRLYALRDVTATVPSIPLIASSIMSKKIASGAHAMVLDVKVGRGAFMTTLEDARELALRMVDIGQRVGRRVTAVLSGMDQPLGLAVGNALEVMEAIHTLQGKGPADFYEHCLLIGGEMLLLAGLAEDPEAARTTLADAVASGAALERFRAWIVAQGGDPRVTEDEGLFPRALVVHEVPAPRSGVIAALDAREVGETSVMLGAGRARKGDPVDLAVGIVLHAKIGDRLAAGQPLLAIHAQNADDARAAAERLLAAYRWSDADLEPPPLVYDVLRG
ncbi:MAG: thymidine phosphorylase [Chloroflexi bacterium]|nr:thymidine phosphorylase [Chloroflexota bacterium]